MKGKGARFEELRELLLGLGFSESTEGEKKAKFTYPGTGTYIMLRAYGPKEIVDPRDLLVARRQLVDNGLIEQSAFDHFLHKASA